MFYFIKTKDLEIEDLALARCLAPFLRDDAKRMCTTQPMRALAPFAGKPCVIDLTPELEPWLVNLALRYHPECEKDFSHVLVNPPKGIKPTGVLHCLRERSEHIPTLYVIETMGAGENGAICNVSRVVDRYHMMRLLARAHNDGWVNAVNEQGKSIIGGPHEQT